MPDDLGRKIERALSDVERAFLATRPVREPYLGSPDWWQFRALGLEAQRRIDETARRADR